MSQQELLNDCHERVRSIRVVSTLLVQVLFRHDTDCLSPDNCNALGSLIERELDVIQDALSELINKPRGNVLFARAAKQLTDTLGKARLVPDAPPSEGATKVFDDIEISICDVFELAGLDRVLGSRALDEAARLRPAAYPTARKLRLDETTNLNAFLGEFGDKVAPENRRRG